MTTTGTIAVVNAMAQGADFDERIGNKIVMKGLEWRLRLQNEVNMTVGKTQHVRFMVVYDKQTNGALPAIGAVLTSIAVNSFKEVANRDRFLILKDQLVKFNTGGIESLTSAGIVDEVHHGFIPLRGLQCTYNAAAAGIGSIATGAIYVIVIGVINAGTVDIDGTTGTRLSYLA